jgi:hypothetical protein
MLILFYLYTKEIPVHQRKFVIDPLLYNLLETDEVVIRKDWEFIRNKIEPAINDVDIYNFYLTKFDKINFTDINTLWQNLTSDVNLSTGYFKSAIDFNIVLKVGTYTSSTLKYVAPGALIKFVPPEGKNFKRGKLVDIDLNDAEQKASIWVKVIKISGDGTNAGRGALASGLGAIQFNDVVPTGAIAAPLKLPLAGFRFNSNGSLFYVGTYGFYWSSTVSGTSARYLNFISSDASMDTRSRSGGGSVRCLKE